VLLLDDASERGDRARRHVLTRAGEVRDHARADRAFYSLELWRIGECAAGDNDNARGVEAIELGAEPLDTIRTRDDAVEMRKDEFCKGVGLIFRGGRSKFTPDPIYRALQGVGFQPVASRCFLYSYVLM
jgi:hypothetical protein